MGVLREIWASTLLTLCALLTAIALEYVGPIERYSLRDRIPGFLMNAMGTMLSLALAYPLGWLWGMLGLKPALTIPLWRWLEPFGTTGYTIQVVILVMLADFLAYWRHRAEHAWFWRIHVVHHAPHELHAANDIAHPVQAVLNFIFIGVPLSLVRIDGPATPFVAAAILILASLYIHSPVQWHLGPLRKLIVDNRFHRIHHSLEERHFDKNFGILLSIWDRLFGTSYDPRDEWPAVGVEGLRAPHTLVEYFELPLTLNNVPASQPTTTTDSGDSPDQPPRGNLAA